MKFAEDYFTEMNALIDLHRAERLILPDGRELFDAAMQGDLEEAKALVRDYGNRLYHYHSGHCLFIL